MGQTRYFPVFEYDDPGAAHDGARRLLALADMGDGDANRGGQTTSVGDQVDLRALLAPVHRIRTCQVPPFRA